MMKSHICRAGQSPHIKYSQTFIVRHKDDEEGGSNDPHQQDKDLCGHCFGRSPKGESYHVPPIS